MLIHIKPAKHVDDRGYFEELYSHRRYTELGIADEFVQENHSLSRNVGTVRGLHFQFPPYAQGKLVRCGRGAIFDVAVDIRLGSPTFGQWEGYELTSENSHQLYVPVGFAHGFVTLEPDSEIIYKCTDYYVPKAEGALHWNSCGINWPLNVKPTFSDKDAIAPALAKFDSPFIFGENS